MLDNSPYLPIGIAKLKKHNIIDRVLSIARSDMIVGTKMRRTPELIPYRNRQAMKDSKTVSKAHAKAKPNITK